MREMKEDAADAALLSTMAKQLVGTVDEICDHAISPSSSDIHRRQCRCGAVAYFVCGICHDAFSAASVRHRVDSSALVPSVGTGYPKDHTMRSVEEQERILHARSFSCTICATVMCAICANLHMGDSSRTCCVRCDKLTASNKGVSLWTAQLRVERINDNSMYETQLEIHPQLFDSAGAAVKHGSAYACEMLRPWSAWHDQIEALQFDIAKVANESFCQMDPSSPQMSIRLGMHTSTDKMCSVDMFLFLQRLYVSSAGVRGSLLPTSN